MKKNTFILFLGFMFLFAYSINVQAEENEDGYVIEGSAQQVYNGSSYTNTFMYSVSSVDSDVGFYIIREYRSSDNKYNYLINAFPLDDSPSKTIMLSQTYRDGIFESETTGELYMNSPVGFCVYSFIDDSLYVTDIPIFDKDDTDAIESYVSTGDKSGATNQDAFVDTYDDSIPLPHNFRIVSGNKQPISNTENYPNRFNKDIVLAWEQEDVIDGLVSDIEVSFTTIHKVDSMSLETRESTSAYYNLFTDVAYNGTPSMTIQVSNSQLNALRDKDGLLLSKTTFRVRNRVGKRTSNWVRVTLDLKTGVATATEESYDDSSETGGDEYNDTTVSGDDSSGGIDINHFLSYVRGGFGLLGDTGIIALLSSVFLYLPGNVWSLIYAYLACVIVIALFLFALKGLASL